MSSKISYYLMYCDNYSALFSLHPGILVNKILRQLLVSITNEIFDICNIE